MEDMVKAIRTYVYERASSPLLMSFGVSWILWNYRLLLIICSAMSPTDKLMAIDLLWVEYTSSFAYWIQFGVLFPLLSALAYLYIYPVPAAYVFKHARRQQKKLKEMQAQIEDETPLTKAESQNLRRAIRNVTREYEEAMASRDATIAAQKQDIVLLEREIAEMKKHGELSSSEAASTFSLNKIEIDTLMKIANAGEALRRSGLLSTDKKSTRIQIEHAIDELQKYGLISESYNQREIEMEYAITPAGRAHAVGILKERQEAA